MNRPLTPLSHHPMGERVPFKAGEGNAVHGPNARAELVEALHDRLRI